MTLSILEKIQEKIPELKKAELRVASYVLENVDNVVNFSITELASEAKTSEPTVIRFCRKVGLRGYTDLRLSLARDVPAVSSTNESIQPEDSPVKILHKSFNAATEALGRSLTSIDPLLFERIIDILASSRRICFYAFGGSGNIAREGHHKFSRLGIPCEVHTDAHMQFTSASLLDKESTVIALSIKGSTRDLIESVRIAKTAGASVIGIIGRKMTPLGKECDVTVAIDVDEAASNIFPFATRFTQLAVLDALYLAVTMRDWPQAKVSLEKVQDTLSHRNY